MSERLHNISLDYLISNLDQINERVDKIEWLMREGFYYEIGSANRQKFCDILLGYYNSASGSAIELKKSVSGRRKATQQLKNGEILLQSLGYEDITKKIVYYGYREGFHYEII